MVAFLSLIFTIYDRILRLLSASGDLFACFQGFPSTTLLWICQCKGNGRVLLIEVVSMYMSRTHGHVTVFISFSGVLEAMTYILNY
jgi:hypothetical protein